MKADYTFYLVDWCGPFHLDITAPRYRTAKDTFDLYRLHGPHPMYGPDVLLYIGKTIQGRKRIAQHFDSLVQNCQRVAGNGGDQNWRYYTGRISREDGQRVLDADVAKVERHLIRSHLPAANSKDLWPAKGETSNSVVMNRGEIGALKARSFVTTKVEYFIPERGCGG
jgi:hypothetical protein